MRLKLGRPDIAAYSDRFDAPAAGIGSPVVLWGEGLPVEEVAAAAGTISYELTCSITRRVRFVEA